MHVCFILVKFGNVLRVRRLRGRRSREARRVREAEPTMKIIGVLHDATYAVLVYECCLWLDDPQRTGTDDAVEHCAPVFGVLACFPALDHIAKVCAESTAHQAPM
jgi:hypothetical protein